MTCCIKQTTIFFLNKQVTSARNEKSGSFHCVQKSPNPANKILKKDH